MRLGIRGADGTDGTGRVKEQIGEEAHAELFDNATHHIEQANLRGAQDEDIPKLRARGFDLEHLRAGANSRLGFEQETQQLLNDAAEGAVALGDRVAWLNDRPPGSQMARASSANAAGSR